MNTKQGVQERVYQNFWFTTISDTIETSKTRQATNIIAEVDAISENSREDFSSIGTKSPMPSIGRVSGFSTLEAVSEMDEKNDNFVDFN